MVATMIRSTSAVAAGVGQRGDAGLGGQRREALLRREPVARVDPGALDDPVVVRVQALGEVVVGDDAAGQRGAEAEDAGAGLRAVDGRAARRVYGTRSGTVVAVIRP